LLFSGFMVCMVTADKLPETFRQSQYQDALHPPAADDVVIVGGGIMGLWAAFYAGLSGMRVRLIERSRIGSGASGGLLGALLPYMPDRWDMKKQLQFDALVRLEQDVARLEAMTGLSTGYRRSGRIIPLPRPHLLPIAEGHETDALAHWRTGDRSFYWHVRNATPVPGWPQVEASGFVMDTLAARVSPRLLVQALRSAIASLGTVTFQENTGVTSINPVAGHVSCSDGNAYRYGHLILANGWESFALLEGLQPPLAKPLGQAVKGQSARLLAHIDPSLPVLFLDGLYIVPHDDGSVAIGSTSENTFGDGFSTDHRLDDLVLQACNLVPALENAQVTERWAGLRPKARLRDPVVGQHPDHPKVLALTGGFKITFGLAHVLAEMAVGIIHGRKPVGLPDSFTFAHHVQAASARVADPLSCGPM
jgi:glycine oxidase